MTKESENTELAIEAIWTIVTIIFAGYIFIGYTVLGGVSGIFTILYMAFCSACLFKLLGMI